jgi:hypothetical protein
MGAFHRWRSWESGAHGWACIPYIVHSPDSKGVKECTPETSIVYQQRTFYQQQSINNIDNVGFGCSDGFSTRTDLDATTDLGSLTDLGIQGRL